MRVKLKREGVGAAVVGGAGFTASTAGMHGIISSAMVVAEGMVVVAESIEVFVTERAGGASTEVALSVERGWSIRAGTTAKETTLSTVGLEEEESSDDVVSTAATVAGRVSASTQRSCAGAFAEAVTTSALGSSGCDANVTSACKREVEEGRGIAVEANSGNSSSSLFLHLVAL